MLTYKCDYPRCEFSETSAEGGPKGMMHIIVTAGRTQRRFHMCNSHAKAIGLDPYSGPQTIEATLLETLAEFVAEVVGEI